MLGFNLKNRLSGILLCKVKILFKPGSTLSESMNAQFRLVISAGIAGIQAPWMDFSLPTLALESCSRRG